MAIVQTGSVVTFSAIDTYAANTGTITGITVPADAEIMLIGVTGWSATANYFSGGTFNIGASTSISVGTASDASITWKAALFYILAPPTGTQNLSWDWAGAATADDADVIISMTYWKGINTAGGASTIRDSDGAQAATTSVTTPTITAQSGDLLVAWAGGYIDPETENTWTWTNATKLADITRQRDTDGSWATTSPSGNQTVTAGSAGAPENAIAAVVLIAAGAGGRVSKNTRAFPLGMNIGRGFSGSY
jgi:hypothetical protein